MFSSTQLLIGKEALERLNASSVLVVGLGGVGAYVAEMLCRAGVGHLTLVDGDVVSVSNKNRQLIALDSTIGKNKTEVLAQRLKDINPNVELELRTEFLRDESMISLLENNTIYKKAFFTRINSIPNTYGLFTTYLLLKPNTVKYINQNQYLFNNSDVWATDGDWKGFNIPSTLLCMQPNYGSEYTNVVTLLTPMPFSLCCFRLPSLSKRNAFAAVPPRTSQPFKDVWNNPKPKFLTSPSTITSYTTTTAVPTRPRAIFSPSWNNFPIGIE